MKSTSTSISDFINPGLEVDIVVNPEEIEHVDVPNIEPEKDDIVWTDREFETAQSVYLQLLQGKKKMSPKKAAAIAKQYAKSFIRTLKELNNND